MGNTGLNNLVLTDAEAVTVGHGDMKAQMDRILADLNALTLLANELKSKFNVHTHRGDGAQAGQYNVSMPQSDAQTIVPVTASSAASATVVVTTK